MVTLEHSQDGVTHVFQVEEIANTGGEHACCVILAEEEQAAQRGCSAVSKVLVAWIRVLEVGRSRGF